MPVANTWHLQDRLRVGHRRNGGRGTSPLRGCCWSSREQTVLRRKAGRIDWLSWMIQIKGRVDVARRGKAVEETAERAKGEEEGEEEDEK